MKRHRHRHRTTTSRVVPWTGCLVSRNCDPRSHNGATHLDTCSCGATRRRANNQGWIEVEAWTSPHDYVLG